MKEKYSQFVYKKKKKKNIQEKHDKFYLIYRYINKITNSCKT